MDCVHGETPVLWYYDNHYVSSREFIESTTRRRRLQTPLNLTEFTRTCGCRLNVRRKTSCRATSPPVFVSHRDELTYLCGRRARVCAARYHYFAVLEKKKCHRVYSTVTERMLSNTGRTETFFSITNATWWRADYEKNKSRVVQRDRVYHTRVCVRIL